MYHGFLRQASALKYQILTTGRDGFGVVGQSFEIRLSRISLSQLKYQGTSLAYELG